MKSKILAVIMLCSIGFSIIASYSDLDDSDLRMVEVESLNFLDIAQAGSESEVENFLASGGDINMQENGHTALMYAALAENVNLVGIFLALGADPNVKSDVSGYTALHCAVQEHSSLESSSPQNVQRIIDLLLAYGARSDIPDKEGKTVYDYLKQSGLGYKVIDEREIDNMPNPEGLTRIEQLEKSRVLREIESHEDLSF